jgi:hypothetical protein
MTDKKKNFSWRGWTTFVTTLSFIVDTLSGIILYIAPPGRIANWTNWNVWGLSREQWVAIHTIFGYVVLFIVAIHLYYNWKMFWNFVWSKIRKALNLKWEMVWATLLCLFIFLGTLWNIPPFSSTMELGDFFKDSWEESRVQTPIAHGELLSLKEFAEKTNVPVEEVLNALKSKGYKVKDIEQTVGEVAKENGVPPNKLYEDMKTGGVKPDVTTIGEGSGMGRKSVEAVCSETGLSLDDALARLKQKGINAKPSDKLKEIANKAGKTPMDIYNIIAGKN